MAVTHEGEATKSLLKENVDPEIKMEAQNSAGPEPGERRKRDLAEGGRIKQDLILNVKQEPDEGPSKNWDVQLQEFLKTLQAPDSGGETAQLPWNDFQATQLLSQKRTEGHKRPGESWLSQDQLHLVGETHQERENSQEASSSAKGQRGGLSGTSFRLEKQRQDFRRLCYQEAEGPREVCRHLQELCHQWLKPEKHTKDQILDLVTLEQFLAILPSDMQSWLRENTPRTCTQAVSLAEDFLVRQQEVKGWSKQMMGMSEEESGKPPKAKQALSEMVKARLFKEARQEAGGDGSSWVDGWPEQQRTSWKSASENDFLLQAETGGSRPGSEQQNGNKKEMGGGQSIHSQRVCQAPDEPTFCDDKGKGDAGGEGLCQRAPLDAREHRDQEEKHYKCWHCSQTFGSSTDLLSHERSHVDEKLYICSHCGERERIRTGQFSHSCSHCGKNFGWIPKERLSAEREKCFMCSECGKCYSRQSDCLKHQKTHAREKLYICAVCGEKFVTYSSLKVHQMVHRGEGSFQCLYCGKCFMSGSHLLLHERVHQAVCSYCGKRFSRPSELVEHERTHAAAE